MLCKEGSSSLLERYLAVSEVQNEGGLFLQGEHCGNGEAVSWQFGWLLPADHGGTQGPCTEPEVGSSGSLPQALRFPPFLRALGKQVQDWKRT